MDDPGESAQSPDRVRPLRTRLQEVQRELGTPWEIIEKDYLLSWILAGLSQTTQLSEKLIFKGGTALKKCYFGDYRFSEDLDFSTLDGVPTGDDMECLVAEACRTAVELLDEYAPVEIAFERYTEREPHPSGQEAFTIRARFPWQTQLHTRVKIEVTMDEPVLRPIQIRAVKYAYGEPFDVELQVYSIEEVVAEKLRAILQQARVSEQCGWSRTRARDFYDLWRILDTYRESIELAGFRSFLKEKCAVRGVAFEAPGDFFPAQTLSDVGRTWEQSLGPLVSVLPHFETVLNGLRPKVEELLTSNDSQ